jgi:hypothetical protein
MRLFLGVARVVFALVVACGQAAAATEGHGCTGPKECCFEVLAGTLPQVQTVSVGAVFVGVYNVNEKAGTWDADYYLYEAWKPLEGFTPQTEIVNETARWSEEFQTVELVSGRCVRSRRLRSSLHSPLDLRLFPFDKQTLFLMLSDTWFDASMARYDDHPMLLGIDEPVRRQLSQWEVKEQDLRYSRERRAFKWEEPIWGKDANAYDNAQISLGVKRHVTFHLVKYFFPLLVIVAMAMSVFWVDPEQLEPQITLGVTCLLAAIAFQLAQASTLPEVAYITLADKVYVVCYITIALALGESLTGNNLSRVGKREQAVRLDRFCRWAFPATVIGGVALALLTSFLRAR